MLLDPQHVVEILHGLPGGAFPEIVETGDDDEATSGFIQSKADVTEIGVCDVLQFRQRARGPDADHGPPGVELAIERFDVCGGLRGIEIHIDRGKNPARERQQMC